MSKVHPEIYKMQIFNALIFGNVILAIINMDFTFSFLQYQIISPAKPVDVMYTAMMIIPVKTLLISWSTLVQDVGYRWL